MSKTGLTLRWLVVPLSFIAFNSSVTWAQSFPGAGVDDTPSLGQFAIRLSKAMGKRLSQPNCPGNLDDPNDPCVIWSPVLYDANTKIGRSAAHKEDDNTDLVADSDLKPFPVTGFIEGPKGTPEVHTQILSLNMTDQGQCGPSSANAVRAGSSMTVVAPEKRKLSLGEVESLNRGNDFPAESFFNMFVEVDIDWNLDNVVDMTVYNPKIPLTVQNLDLQGFPPQVVYIHGGNKGDSAPPVYDVSTGKLVGWIVLAGHGVGREVNCAQRTLFGEELRDRAPDIIKKSLTVTMGDFQTQVNNGEVTLNWATVTELNNAAFRIWRAELLPGGTQCTLNIGDYLPQTVQVVGLVSSQATGVSGANYSYSENVASGTYCYAIEDIEYGGVPSSFHFPNNQVPVIVQ